MAYSVVRSRSMRVRYRAILTEEDALRGKQSLLGVADPLNFSCKLFSVYVTCVLIVFF